MTEPNESQIALGFDLRDKIADAMAGTLIVVSEGHDGYSTIERDAAETLADAVIRELKVAKACEGGCVWQIPNHVEDMTQAQRELLGMMTDPAQKIADSTRRDHLGPFTDPEKFAE